MGRSHEQQVMVPAPPEQVAQRVCHVVAALPKAAGVALNPPYVTASIGTGMWSLGGRRSSSRLSEVPGGSAVRIRSECVFPLQTRGLRQEPAQRRADRRRSRLSLTRR
ncbi:hypothetical protein G5V59_18050 [Nocardioides sp. W3-2-3]|uniref:hypothetical protein n=1 Tax=Nocardioides convexus TaxID=2712224 RepID=UPI0024188EB5|nr:hypothetical protein [Nocardioides convexus]NHA01128.1 hypothetical protein [Nocardioides convexus]